LDNRNSSMLKKMVKTNVKYSRYHNTFVLYFASSSSSFNITIVITVTCGEDEHR